jgi:hypothetical protein
MDWNSVFSDPDFQALPQEEKRKALVEMDTDFSSLPPAELDKAIKDMSGAGMPAAPQAPANPLMQAIQQGASAALTPFSIPQDGSRVQPIQPQGSNPLLMALDAAKQTGQNPQRVIASLRQPSRVAGEATENAVGGLPGKAAGAVVETVLDPATFAPVVGGSKRVLEILRSGKRIGAAEKAAGVITKAADKYPTSGNVGEMLNTLEGQLDNGTLTDPQTLKVAKDMLDFVWKNPHLVGKSKGITVQSTRVAQKLQQALNQAIPGRAGPAADFAKLQSIIQPVKTIAKVGVGAAAAGGTLAAIRQFLGR